MKRRVILTGVPARQKLALGAKKLADAIGSTIGPHGQNFVIDNDGGKITNDGVTIAREFQLSDEVENKGVSLLREPATKTELQVGDGTTTTIVLGNAIYEIASRELAKENVVGRKTASEINRQIEKERQEVTNTLTASATPITTREQLVDSAIVSTEDKDLGTLIADAQWELGADGVLIAEETAERNSSYERVPGIRIDNGVGTSFVFNNVQKQKLELNDVPVILTSYTIKDFEALSKILDRLLKSGKKEVVVIARAWTDEAIKICQINHQQGFKIYPISGPYVDHTERYKDIEAVTGGTFYDSESSYLEDMQLSDLGFIRKLDATRYTAIIIGNDDGVTQERRKKRADQLSQQLDGSMSDFEKRTLNERIAQLNRGFGIIKVGSPLETERKRLYDKAVDAVWAVRGALQEGTVKGAGLSLKEIADTLPDDYILKRAISSPYELIMKHAPSGFIVEDWVRDPLKVVRVALQNACLAASSLANAGGIITEEFPHPINEQLGIKGT